MIFVGVSTTKIINSICKTIHNVCLKQEVNKPQMWITNELSNKLTMEERELQMFLGKKLQRLAGFLKTVFSTQAHVLIPTIVSHALSKYC